MATTSHITTSIQSNAALHEQLSTSLAELDYAPSALQQQSSYFKELEAQVKDLDSIIQQLTKRTTKEKKEFEELRDSMTSRLRYKLQGKKEKYQSKVEKEEKDYIGALEEQHVTALQRDSLKKEVEQAKKTNADLQTAVDRHSALKTQLEELYARIFSGPTPDFPEEDMVESSVTATQAAYDRVQQQLNCESQAASMLADAAKAMSQCLQAMESALDASNMDLWGFNGADWMERSALSEAQSAAGQAQFFATQAQRTSPHVKPIGEVRISNGNMWGDIVFDNIFSDLAMHDKIKASRESARASNLKLQSELTAANQRVRGLGRDLKQATDDLNQARSELFSTRQSAFNGVVAGAPPAPPSYQAPAGPPPHLSSYAPPPGPPPIAVFGAPENLSAPQAPASPMNSPGSPGGGPITWGSMNPYAAALANHSRVSALPFSNRRRILISLL